MRILLITFVIIFPYVLLAQDKSDIIQQRIEFISEKYASEDIDLTTVFDQLNYYYLHPLNLNLATKEDLESLNLLSEIQIQDLMLHIKLNGKLRSIFEIQALKYWDEETINLLLPFVNVDDKLDEVKLSRKLLIRDGNFELYSRCQSIIQNKKGDLKDNILVNQNSNTTYLGGKNHYYTRFRYSYKNNISLGVTGDKDAGEEFFRGSNQNGFDFYSMHAFYKGGKYLKSFVLGDYQVELGQGLNFWSGFAFGKSSDVTNIKKSANGISPYLSSDESHFLRGSAIELGYKKFSVLAFTSLKKQDGIVLKDAFNANREIITSLQTTGFHRTTTEIERRKVIDERIQGLNLKYSIRNFNMGFSSVYQGFDLFYSKQIQAYNQFDFRGKEFISNSIDYSWLFKNVSFFGEISKSTFSKGIAQLYGMIISLDTRVALSVLYRDYAKDYQLFYNSGFAEGSGTQNEKGLYTGFKLKLNNTLVMNTYLDYFSFPWLKYQVNSPSNGHEFLVQLTYKPSKRLEIYCRFREQLKQKNSTEIDGSIKQLDNLIQKNYRFNMNYNVSDNTVLKSRVELVTLNSTILNKEIGTIISQDVQFKPKNSKIDFSLRYVLFQTDSYETRIYIYESNAATIFSIPAYYYKGSRAYFLIHANCFKYFDCWVKYGTFVYNNQSTIGTGSEQIQGNVKSEISIQIRMKF